MLLVVVIDCLYARHLFNSYITAQTESVLEHFRVFGHVKGKQFSAKERQDREDPYR
jgi:hypothetical protein